MTAILNFVEMENVIYLENSKTSDFGKFYIRCLVRLLVYDVEKVFHLPYCHPRSAEVTHIADFKSAYISLIIGPRGLQCEANL